MIGRSPSLLTFQSWGLGTFFPILFYEWRVFRPTKLLLPDFFRVQSVAHAIRFCLEKLAGGEPLAEHIPLAKVPHGESDRGIVGALLSSYDLANAKEDAQRGFLWADSRLSVEWLFALVLSVKLGTRYRSER